MRGPLRNSCRIRIWVSLALPVRRCHEPGNTSLAKPVALNPKSPVLTKALGVAEPREQLLCFVSVGEHSVAGKPLLEDRASGLVLATVLENLGRVIGAVGTHGAHGRLELLNQL